jgi:hypothetical protein
LNRIRSIILSKKFLPVIFIFFLIQAAFYAVTVDYSIPSDEDYHYESIKYYADQPVTTGPFTDNQDPGTIKAVNNIDRNAKYLYHYLFSLPQRGFDYVELSEDTQILIFRFISIILAFLSLLVLKKIFDELTNDKLIKNIALAAFVLTGMFVWLAASINYDNLANLLFLIFILLIIRFIRGPDWYSFTAILSTGMAMVLTKHTFMPMLLLGVGISSYFLIKIKPKDKLAKILKKPNFKVFALILVFLLTSFLFIERIGGNLAQYGAVDPKCNEFFTSEVCGVYRVSARNYKQKAQYSEEEKNRVMRDWDPFTHTGIWTYKMYNSLPWYLGHQRIESNIYSEISAALLAAIFAVTLIFSRKKIRLKKEYKTVIAFTVVYFLILYLFNLNSYFNVGKMNAYQGRYLLPVLGFFFLFMITLALNSYRSMRGLTKTIFSYLWLIVVAVYVVMHFTPLIFLIGTDSSWFDNIPPPYY